MEGFYGNFQRREVPWEKVPFVPRPSLVPDPITAFGKRQPKSEVRKRSILEQINREAIKPDPVILARPIDPYVSARDATREKVRNELKRQENLRTKDGSNTHNVDRNSMDILLERVHGTVGTKKPHRQIFFVEPSVRKISYY